jgi:dipeptidyl aminopeptidase/acylaminoacyl peptidase
MDVPSRCPPFRLFLAAVTAVLCLHLAAIAQVAQPAPASTANPADPRLASLLDSLDRVRTPTYAAISPDGNTVAWTFHADHGSELHLTRIAPAGSAPDRVLSPDTIGDAARSKPGACTASQPAWSPDGSQLAFLSNCSDRLQSASGQNASNGKLQPSAQQNLFVWTLAANAMKQVSHLRGEVSSLQWSPDGQSIAFLYVENASREPGALAAMKPWSGVIGEDNVEVQRIAVVDVSSGKFSQDNFQKNLHVYEFAWAPDSKGFVFTAAASPGENNWWVAKLYIHYYPFPTICAGLCGPLVVFDPSRTTTALKGLQIAVPRFSTDGKRIAFIGGLMSDQGSTGGDVWVVNNWDISNKGTVPPGEPKDVTPNRPASPAYIAWLDDHDIGISEHFGGGSRIAALDLTTGKDVPGLDFTFPETIYSGDDSMSVSLASRSPNIALIRQSFARPPEVWAGPSDNLRQITHLNDAIQPAWGKTESIDYTNDGLPIQGWLLYPANFDPTKNYPLIVSVHGGPSSAMTPRWPSATYSAAPLSALGDFVFYPNPRGSFGQGERFTQANVKDFGYGDLRDILAGVDLLEKRFPIDKSREGITGWSYGGFMTMFAVTQTTRFRAAVAGAGLANWQSYYGQNSIDQWMLPFFGASVYDDPEVYAKSSPINFIKNVKTPTLLLVGDRDGECPAPQSFEFWHALRAVGVPAQLVVYPGEGHHFVSPEHQRDLLRRTIGWFQAQMPPS